jgi:hypothetical protein
MTNSLAKFSFVVALLVFSAANAQDGMEEGFVTPSGNIACLYSNDNGKSSLRCDIGETVALPPRPADCKLEWGHSFEMEANGTAGRICTDDHTFDPGLSDLAYGKTWHRGGFTCRSEPGGLTCLNAMQHGFSLSRSEQRLF